MATRKKASKTSTRARRVGQTAFQLAELRFPRGFRVVMGNARAQAAEMVIPPGESEGGPRNDHCGSDQWLYVVSGRGWAHVGGETTQLRRGTILLLLRGTRHEIRSTGPGELRTFNLYVPPAYTARGVALPRGRPSKVRTGSGPVKHG